VCRTPTGKSTTLRIVTFLLRLVGLSGWAEAVKELLMKRESALSSRSILNPLSRPMQRERGEGFPSQYTNLANTSQLPRSQIRPICYPYKKHLHLLVVSLLTTTQTTQAFSS